MNRFEALPAAQRAGILCHDAQFQKFAAEQCGIREHAFNETATAQYLRGACNIISRADLNNGGHALQRFERICTDFDQWRGLIATPRR